MANIKDVSDVIQSALVEVGVDGTLHVEMDGQQRDKSVGDSRGQDVEVVVLVRPVAEAA